MMSGWHFQEDATPTPGNDVGELAVDDDFIYWGAENEIYAQDKRKPDAAHEPQPKRFLSVPS